MLCTRCFGASLWALWGGAIAPASHARQVLRLSTTTSTDNSGWLAYLLPAFEAKSGMKVHVIAVGTGKALVTPYSTHYFADSMKERLLVRLRGSLAEFGLARTGGAGAYEAHIAGLGETMRHLTLRGWGAAGGEQQKN